MYIVDTPKNKPAVIEIKPKGGLSGKENVKIYHKNKRGSATIMVTKPSGSDVLYAQTLAFKIIKYLLEGLISGVVKEPAIEFKKKRTNSVKESSKDLKNSQTYSCDLCEKVEHHCTA